MDGAALTASEHAGLKALSRRSDVRGLLRFGEHLLLLAGTTTLVLLAEGGPWLVPALLLQGTAIVFLFCAAHEAIHRTAFRTRALNDAVAWICGLAILLPPAHFRAFHLAHHRYTQDPARDPELTEPKPRSLGAYLRHLSGLAYWRGQIAALLRHASGRVEETYVRRQDRGKVVREARLFLAVYAGVAGLSLWASSALAMLVWVVPVLLGQPVLRAFLLAEHHGCPENGDMMLNSRTTRSNAVLRWLAWNMPFHGAHHAYPALPFFALPAAQKILSNRARTQASGYLAFHRDVVAGYLGGR
ncbi:MAG: fatty acid desaturase [Kiloniellales bacterium]|nr:fatty acid desaturase [Kiloniellales bacterium]